MQKTKISSVFFDHTLSKALLWLILMPLSNSWASDQNNLWQAHNESLFCADTHEEPDGPVTRRLVFSL